FEEHGAQLRIVEPLMDRSLLDGLNDFWRARLWSELLLLDETRRARVLPYVHAWAEGGAPAHLEGLVETAHRIDPADPCAARLFG
ncbi:amidase, partial [Pseudomonas aeruginosa]